MQRAMGMLLHRRVLRGLRRQRVGDVLLDDDLQAAGSIISEANMRSITIAALIVVFAAGAAMAQSCESRAVSAEGKPLHGAAKTSFLKKCKLDACEGKAVSAEGKPLHGAAKNSFMAKCKKSA
jgi:hypothetical protein